MWKLALSRAATVGGLSSSLGKGNQFLQGRAARYLATLITSRPHVRIVPLQPAKGSRATETENRRDLSTSITLSERPRGGMGNTAHLA